MTRHSRRLQGGAPRPLDHVWSNPHDCPRDRRCSRRPSLACWRCVAPSARTPLTRPGRRAGHRSTLSTGCPRTPACSPTYRPATSGSTTTVVGLRRLRQGTRTGPQGGREGTGLRPENLNSVTFHFPKFPQGPGDEEVFVLQVTTKKPYDKDTVAAGAPSEVAKGT